MAEEILEEENLDTESFESEQNVDDSPAQDKENGSKKKYKKIIKLIFVLLVIVFLAYHFYSNRKDYAQINLSGINIKTLGLAVLIHFVYKIMQASLWHYITYLNDCSIKWWDAVVAYLISIFGKYIPGKVFMLFARVPAYEEKGKSIARVSASFLIENVCTLLGAAFLFLISLIFIPSNVLNEMSGVYEKYKWAILIVIVLFFVCIHPTIINFFLGILQKLTKKDNLKIPMTYPQMLKVVVLFILNWFVLGVGYYLVVYSLYPIGTEYLLYVGGVFGLSVMAGILALFAPGGAGVREGVMIILLTLIIPEEPNIADAYAVSIAILARLWMTVSEFSVIGLGYLADIIKKKIKNIKAKKVTD